MNTSTEREVCETLVIYCCLALRNCVCVCVRRETNQNLLFVVFVKNPMRRFDPPVVGQADGGVAGLLWIGLDVSRIPFAEMVEVMYSQCPGRN